MVSGEPSAQGSRNCASSEGPWNTRRWDRVQGGEGGPLLPQHRAGRKSSLARGVPLGLHLLCVSSQQLISFLYGTVFTVYTIAAKPFCTPRQQTITVPNTHVRRTNCPSVSHKAFIKNSRLELGAVSNSQKNLQSVFPENRARKCLL